MLEEYKYLYHPKKYNSLHWNSAHWDLSTMPMDKGYIAV